ncbi:MAG: hypothetical protein ACFFB0_04800 [Promethearchaeota archaeon]
MDNISKSDGTISIKTFENLKEQLKNFGQKFNDQTSRLIKSVNEQINEVEKKTDDLLNKYDQKINNLINKLTQSSKDQSDKLNQKFDERITKLEKKFDDQIVQLDKRLKSQIDNLNKKIEDITNIFDQELNDKFREINQNSEGKFESITEILNLKFKDVSEKLEGYNNSTESNIQAIRDNLRNVNEDLLTELNRLKDEFDTKEEVQSDLLKKLENEHSEYKIGVKQILDDLKSQQDLVKISVDVLKKQIFETLKEWIGNEIKNACKNKEKEILMNLWIEELKEIIGNFDKLKETSPKELKIHMNEISNVIESYKQKFTK